MYFEYEQYLRESPQYQEMFHDMKAEVKCFMEEYHDDPRFISGWGHGYFCNEDGGRLIYNRQKPFDHQCSICGKVYRGYQYDACHVTMLRNEAVVTAVKSALLYTLSKDEYFLEVTKQVIEHYACHYDQYCLHAKNKIDCDPAADVGGAGKIMPQGLNEAIIAIRMINALELIKDQVEEEWLQSLKERLFTPIYQLLLPQKMHIHNIPTWINSAIGVMGFFYQDAEWIKEATENPFHIFEQLKKGVTDSGFWYEGSIHYNFFALEGVMNFLVFAEAYQFTVPEQAKATVLKMFKAAYHYAFENDIFPNPSDGWPNISLKTYSYVYYMAYKVFGEEIKPYLFHIEANSLERTRLPLSEPYYYKNRIPLERVLFAPDVFEKKAEKPDKRLSHSFESSNCAILRNDIYNVFFKYGHQTISHAHPDKMNIEIMVKGNVLTKDLSNSGYASKMCNQWHRKNTAHTTCMIDGKETDISKAGKLLAYTENVVEAEAEAYEGCLYRRRIELKEGCLKDIFVVEAKKARVIDWFFHFETDVMTDGMVLKVHEGLLEHKEIFEVNEIITEGSSLVVINDLVTMSVELEPGMKAYLGKSYNNPADRMRDTLILRKEGDLAKFDVLVKAL